MGRRGAWSEQDNELATAGARVLAVGVITLFAASLWAVLAVVAVLDWHAWSHRSCPVPDSLELNFNLETTATAVGRTTAPPVVHCVVTSRLEDGGALVSRYDDYRNYSDGAVCGGIDLVALVIAGALVVRVRTRPRADADRGWMGVEHW